jgi:hypothetical protein
MAAGPRGRFLGCSSESVGGRLLDFGAVAGLHCGSVCGRLVDLCGGCWAAVPRALEGGCLTLWQSLRCNCGSIFLMVAVDGCCFVEMHLQRNLAETSLFLPSASTRRLPDLPTICQHPLIALPASLGCLIFPWLDHSSSMCRWWTFAIV